MAGSRRFFLGVDGGQSSTRAVIGDETGRILARAVGAPCWRATPGAGEATLRKTASELLRDLLALARLPAASGFEAACFGMSGGADDKRLILEDVTPSSAIEVTNDAEAALDGATGGGAGIVIIAGTGSIALARDGTGNTTRCGGWGYLFGDDGGALDIVRGALRAALAAEEGWGEPTELRGPLLRATGSATVNEAMHRFYDPDWPRDRIASLAPVVDEAATQGDEPARALLQAAGEALGALAARAARALPADLPESAVYPSGGVFKSDRIRGALALRLRSAGRSLRTPAHDAATGALLRAYWACGLNVQAWEPK